MTRRWAGAGPTFEIDWAGRPWILHVGGARPGLTAADDRPGSVLGLAGVAEPGRWEADALSGASLVGVETRHGRVEATYAPPGWWDLTVRAAWSPRGQDGMDLEIQVSTLSVGKLRRVEVFAQNDPAGASSALGERVVEPSNARSASLSYDGREPTLDDLTTLPPGPIPPLLSRYGEADPPVAYVEFVHPQDVTRRIRREADSRRSARYGLFGHDLEKGIVLRARLRGLWLPAEAAEGEARGRFAEFLAEPPPLLT